MKSHSVFFSILASLSIFIGGIMFLAYGYLPHQDYLPMSLALTAASGVVVYIILTRIVRL